MRLDEALARANMTPEVGDHVVVYDDKHVAHYLFVSYVNPKDPHELGFMCPCLGIQPGTDTNKLEIAPIVTCLECLTKA
jgi:hypothetical protein